MEDVGFGFLASVRREPQVHIGKSRISTAPGDCCRQRVATDSPEVSWQGLRVLQDLVTHPSVTLEILEVINAAQKLKSILGRHAGEVVTVISEQTGEVGFTLV